MKSTHNKAEQVQKEIKYPCLMVANETGVIVLFESPKCGMVVSSTPRSQSVSHYSKVWDMSYFTPLPPTESVTLSND